MIPSLDDSLSTPTCGSVDLGNSYILLPKHDTYAISVPELECPVIVTYLQQPGTQKVRRWGRLHLPNGQIARSLYAELDKVAEQVQMAWNIKVRQ